MDRRKFIRYSLASVTQIVLMRSESIAAPSGVSQLSTEEFFELRRKINEDYAQGNVIIIDGWIVSETEADFKGPF